MLEIFKKKEDSKLIQVDDQSIVAIADGRIIDVATVPDDVFAQQMMGISTAFAFSTEEVTLCSPANGILSVLFPTGHAYGITMNDGTELLVHIGIDTVQANGDGFTVLKHQGDCVKAGNPIVTVNLKKLRKKYDMSVIMIVIKKGTQEINFIKPCIVSRGQNILSSQR